MNPGDIVELTENYTVNARGRPLLLPAGSQYTVAGLPSAGEVTVSDDSGRRWVLPQRLLEVVKREGAGT